MNILILGGTVFMGIQLVNYAQKRNHNVTLFNRGKRNPDIFPDVEKLFGDRNSDLAPLNGRKFDAVIDTCGHVPGIVRKSAELLKDNTDNYTFISSISAYSDFSKHGQDESGETCKIADGNIEEMTMENYGAMKVLCENVVSEVFGDRALNIRPGLIVGENDWSDRFTYWIHRIDQGGKVLAPDGKKDRVQFIDVKDLSEWTIKMAEGKKSGLYNATGPDYKLTFEEFINTCQKVTGGKAEIIWAKEKFLLDENITPWMELPMWVTEADQGINNMDISKAIKDGLTFRPLEETLMDTLKFDKSRKDYTLRAGLKPERETEVISKLL
ncbi:MAG TPA: NAD-dependent epimerase/dehydratase family protein [Ignavibacteria bacterium]|nr:NAD-dependent epimerase/dehydratase family protein [Ignavibacteria bacterium]